MFASCECEQTAVFLSGWRRDLTIGKREARRNKTGGAELRLLLRPKNCLFVRPRLLRTNMLPPPLDAEDYFQA
jgi:hypothetical protein